MRQLLLNSKPRVVLIHLSAIINSSVDLSRHSSGDYSIHQTLQERPHNQVLSSADARGPDLDPDLRIGDER